MAPGRVLPNGDAITMTVRFMRARRRGLGGGVDEGRSIRCLQSEIAAPLAVAGLPVKTDYRAVFQTGYAKPGQPALVARVTFRVPLTPGREDPRLT